MSDKKDLDIVGRVEKIDLLDLNISGIHAKVDTGADSCSIWASQIEEKDGRLYCIFFGPGSPYYTGEAVCIDQEMFKLTRVANSFGHKEVRYKIKLRIKLSGRIVRANFTLSDRSKKIYPILLGRKLLSGKFLVDVSQGDPLLEEEKAHTRKLQKDLMHLKEEN